MIIKNKRMIEWLKYYEKECLINKNDNAISLIDDNTGEIDEKQLSKIKNFIYQTECQNVKDVEDELKELSNILKIMELESCEIEIFTKEYKSVEVQIDSIINSLNRNIKKIGISGIDLSMSNPQIFSEFNNLESLSLNNTNLKNLEIVYPLDSRVDLDTFNNPVNNKISKEIIDVMKKHKGMVYFNNGTRYDGEIAELSIKSIRDIELDVLKECATSIDTVALTKDNILAIPDAPSSIDRSVYSKDEFIAIMEEIKKIINQVIVPNNDDPDREKKIFMQVYKILGEKIEYNNYLLTEEGRKDKEKWKNSSNLLDGLTKNKCVCNGYAQILETILGEFGIKSIIQHRWPLDGEMWAYEASKYCTIAMEELIELQKKMKILRIDDFEMGHAWNTVDLDGKKYVCDLTLDAENIRNGNFPLVFCCCSLEQFMREGHYKYDRADEYFENISEITEEEQLKYLGFNEYQSKKIVNISEEEKGIQILENGVLNAAANIKSSDFEIIENKLIKEQGEKNYDREN